MNELLSMTYTPNTIYPKCLMGLVPTFVSQTGFLAPCCWASGDVWNPGSQMQKDRIFERFDIRDYDTVDDILDSLEWENMMEEFIDWDTAYPSCKRHCSKPLETNEYYDSNGDRIIYDARPKNEALHLELTSRCTLACPRCPRTNWLGQYAIADIDMSVMEIIARSSHRSWVCVGNIGDPIYHRQFHDVVELANDTDKHIFMHTNGGRNIKWWEKTVDTFEQSPHDRHAISFSIDGLEDTNHIYRVGSKWEQCFNAMKLCAQSDKLTVTWKFIVFKHNQHQIAEAKEIADSIGVDFTMVKSNRWKGKNDPLKPDDNFVSEYNYHDIKIES